MYGLLELVNILGAIFFVVEKISFKVVQMKSLAMLITY